MDFNFLLTCPINRFNSFVMAADVNLVKMFLKEPNIRYRILSILQLGDFDEFIKKNGQDIVGYFLDDKIFALARLNNHYLDKINVIIENIITIPDALLSDDSFLDSCISLNIELKHIDYFSCLKLFKHYISNIDKYNITLYKFLLKFNPDNVKKIIDNDLGKEYKKNDLKLSLCLTSFSFANVLFDKSLIPLLAKLPYFKFESLLMGLENIPDDILDDQDFINLIVNISDPIKYRSIIYILSNKMDVSNIEKKRRKYVKKKLSTELTPLGLFKEHQNTFLEIVKGKNISKFRDKFTNSNYRDLLDITDNRSLSGRYVELEKFFTNLSNMYLTDYIIDYLFNDYYHNIIVNIEQIIKFISNNNLSIIEKTHLDFYKMILLFDNYDIEKKLSLFEQLKNLKITEMYYDDLRTLKDYSYKSLVDGALNNETILPLQDKKFSRKYRVPIYYLDGQDFCAIVRSFRISKKNYPTLDHNVINSMGADGFSFSYIGTKNIETFYDPKVWLNFAYFNLDPKSIVHVCHMDSYSSYDLKSNRNASQMANELHTSKSILDESLSYNEIVIDNHEHIPIKPNALLCYDSIMPYDVDIAKKLDIPILLINTLKYFRASDIIDQNSPYYVEKYSDISNTL